MKPREREQNRKLHKGRPIVTTTDGTGILSRIVSAWLMQP